jgi:hypothetical protein
LSIPCTVLFKSITLGTTVCLRAKASNWRVRSAERCEAFRRGGARPDDDRQAPATLFPHCR